MKRCLLALSLFVGCEHRDNDVRTAAPSRPTEEPWVEAKGAAPSTPSTPVDPNAISGTVLETMNASTYTYVRLDRGGSEVWVAGPQATLAVGTKLEKLRGQLMSGFHSKSLNRTFDAIYFVNSFGTAPAADPHAGMASNAGADPHAGMATTPAAPTAPAADPARDEVSGTVVQTMDAAGYTYAELDRNGKKSWVAGPTTKLAVGTKLGKMSGSLMTGFHSNTLNRTFDQIYFVDSYAIAN